MGEAVEELLKNAITDSLVFKFIDRRTLDTAMEEIKLSLTGITDEKDSVEIGNIRGLRLLMDGSVTSEDGSFVVSLRLIEVETTEIIAIFLLFSLKTIFPGSGWKSQKNL